MENLSGGEKARIVMARLMLQPADLLVGLLAHLLLMTIQDDALHLRPLIFDLTYERQAISIWQCSVHQQQVWLELRYELEGFFG